MSRRSKKKHRTPGPDVHPHPPLPSPIPGVDENRGAEADIARMGDEEEWSDARWQAELDADKAAYDLYSKRMDSIAARAADISDSLRYLMELCRVEDGIMYGVANSNVGNKLQALETACCKLHRDWWGGPPVTVTELPGMEVQEDGAPSGPSARVTLRQ
jgi:hypothetical protein